MSNEISTPMGKISILIDEVEVPYIPIKGEIVKRWFPDILGRYFIKVNFIPDGKSHEIACVIPYNKDNKHDFESGENLECQAFYSKDSVKLSIGTFGDVDPEAPFDYDVEYLSDGMQYNILPETKTQEYVFGICWIDDVDSDEYTEGTNDRDTQTWFGADPTIFEWENNHD